MKPYSAAHLQDLSNLRDNLEAELNNPKWRQDEREKLEKEIQAVSDLYEICDLCDMENCEETHPMYKTQLLKVNEIDESLYIYLTGSAETTYKNECALSKQLKRVVP